MAKSRRYQIIIVLLVMLVLGHAYAVSLHADRASSATRIGSKLVLPYQLIRPDFTVDGHMWIRYAVRLVEGEQVRLRHSDLDNAPFGREVHWNSGYAWWIAAWGWIWQKCTNLPLTLATEQASIWLNAPLIIGFVLLFSGWAARHWGWNIGAAVGSSLVLVPYLYEGFWPGYADHHGLIAASLLGLALGAAMMSGGWVSRDDARAKERAIWAARCSGFWGGVALWISAASAVPMIALVAISSLAVRALTRRTEGQTDTFSPAIWRSWGVTGAMTSLGFYALEYFPSHLGWRLEVNHPLYALAWLAGAEIIAQVMPLLTPGADRKEWRPLLLTAAWAVPVAAAPAIAVAIWKAQVFLPIDPFMADLHKSIVEFQPLSARLVRASSVSSALIEFNAPLVYVCGLVVLLLPTTHKRPMFFALALTIPMHALAFYQARWLASAGPGHVLILVCLLRELARLPWISHRRWRITVAACLLLLNSFGVGLYTRGLEIFGELRQMQLGVSDVRQMISREVAHVIRESQPDGQVILFATPNASVSVGFFGDFKTLGTLYWENLAGLRAAAEISSARTDEEAARLIKARGVTHVALFKEDNYFYDYAKLLNPAATNDDIRQTFGYRLTGDKTVPIWLQALPYSAPKSLPKQAETEALIFKVNFDQKPAEAAYRIGLLQISRGEINDALTTFAQVLEIDPTFVPAALRSGEIHIGRKEWDAAQRSFDLAVKNAPANEHYPLLTQSGIAFDSVGEQPHAVANYERALRETPTNPIAANNLAWILATSKQDDLRNPTRALELARRCVDLDSANPALLSTLAAAQATSGQFDEAVATLERATTLAKAQGAQTLLPQLEQCLAAYRARKLWLTP